MGKRMGLYGQGYSTNQLLPDRCFVPPQAQLPLPGFWLRELHPLPSSARIPWPRKATSRKRLQAGRISGTEEENLIISKPAENNTEERKSVSQSQSVALATNVAGVRTIGTGPWRLKSHRVTQVDGIFRVCLLTCSPVGLGCAEPAPGCAVAALTSSE